MYVLPKETGHKLVLHPHVQRPMIVGIATDDSQHRLFKGRRSVLLPIVRRRRDEFQFVDVVGHTNTITTVLMD
jgi:hypothetical protein